MTVEMGTFIDHVRSSAAEVGFDHIPTCSELDTSFFMKSGAVPNYLTLEAREKYTEDTFEKYPDEEEKKKKTWQPKENGLIRSKVNIATKKKNNDGRKLVPSK